jgi:hypothetical protein
MPIHKISLNKVRSFFKKRSDTGDTDDTLQENPWEYYDQEIVQEPEEINQDPQENNDENDGWYQEEEQEIIENNEDNNLINTLLLLLFIILIPNFIIRMIILSFYLYVYIDLFKIKLLSLKLSREREIRNEKIDPFKILFSQASISTKFQNGTLIETTIENLVNGNIKPDFINNIRVCVVKDRLHTLDNRRLYCFQEAIRRGAEFKEISINLVRKEGYYDENVEWKMTGAKFIVKKNDWTNVIVSPSSRNGYHFEK